LSHRRAHLDLNNRFGRKWCKLLLACLDEAEQVLSHETKDMTPRLTPRRKMGHHDRPRGVVAVASAAAPFQASSWTREALTYQFDAVGRLANRSRGSPPRLQRADVHPPGGLVRGERPP
jgi:hypothetical protein